MKRSRWPRLVGCWRWVRAVIDACAGDRWEDVDESMPRTLKDFNTRTGR